MKNIISFTAILLTVSITVTGQIDLNKAKKNINDRLVRKHLAKEKEYFLYPFIQEQKYQNWLKVKKIDFFLIDSFAELVDQ